MIDCHRVCQGVTSLSGIDEQDTDIPVCPLCEKRPLFWSLYPTIDGDTKDGGFWLFSEKFMRTSNLNKLTSNGFFDLNAVRSVKCRPIREDISYRIVVERHVFEKGSKVFNVVMKMARKEEK